MILYLYKIIFILLTCTSNLQYYNKLVKMLIYITWKLDFNQHNKLVILNLSKEKQENNEYIISKKKFLITSLLISRNFNYEQIFYTRVKSKSYNTNDKLYFLNIEKYDTNNNLISIDLFLTNSKIHRTLLLKQNLKYKSWKFINEDNVLNDEQIINTISKNINNSGLGEFVNNTNNIYKFIIFEHNLI